jgi:hypothetical protein
MLFLTSLREAREGCSIHFVNNKVCFMEGRVDGIPVEIKKAVEKKVLRVQLVACRPVPR